MQDSRSPVAGPTEAHTPPSIPSRMLPRVPSWIVDALAALFIVGVAVMPFGGEEFRPSTPFAFVMVLAPAVLLPFRRRWPVAVLAAMLAIYGATALTGTLSPGVVLAAAIAMFSVATQSTRRRSIITAACAILGIALLSLFAALGSVFDPRAIQFAVTLAFAAAAGDATRSRREYIVAITERAERAERSREEEAPGATPVPQPGLERLDALMESFGEAGLQVNVRSEGDMEHVSRATSLVAYRVIQEALTNAHKHGTENRAHVLLALTDTELSVIVTNPISGPISREASDRAAEGADARAAGGLGLLGLRERVASVRGSVTTGTAAGGYRVAVTLPRQHRPQPSTSAQGGLE